MATFHFLRYSIFFLSLFSIFSVAQAQQTQTQSESENSTESRVLKVGTKVAPPFVVKNEDGSLSGLSIDLWEQAANELNLQYEFLEKDLASLISGLEDGSIDASVAALTVTSSREERIDFTHPFYTTGLGIAVPDQDSSAWTAIKRFFSWEFLVALSALIGILLAVGMVLWAAERKKNPEMFGGSSAKGIGNSFWWAAVTMTTVGYGDYAPRTLLGRLVGLVWMFAAIIMISTFTAAIATSLTVSQLESSIKNVDDLAGVRVATVGGSASDEYLSKLDIGAYRKATLEDALDDLGRGKVDAVVHDKPILLFLANQEYPKRTRVLPGIFGRQDYGIGLAEGSGLREPLNLKILEIVADLEWRNKVKNYLGKEE